MLSFGQQARPALRDEVTPHKVALHVVTQALWAQLYAPPTQLVNAENAYTEREERELVFTLLQLVQVSRCTSLLSHTRHFPPPYCAKSLWGKHHVVVQYMARWMKCPLPPAWTPPPSLDPPAWTPPPPSLDHQGRINDITGKGLRTAVALSTASYYEVCKWQMKGCTEVNTKILCEHPNTKCHARSTIVRSPKQIERSLCITFCVSGVNRELPAACCGGKPVNDVHAAGTPGYRQTWRNTTFTQVQDAPFRPKMP